MRAVAIALVVAVGCAAPPRVPIEKGEHASIVYAPIPLPLVRGSVAGKRTLIVLDTGTGGNVVAGWLARTMGLATTKYPEPTHDPSGRPVALERIDDPRLVIDGFDPLPDRPTAVADLPPGFEKAGIGAIVSPQRLARADAMIEIDMPRGEIRRVRAAEIPGASDVCTLEDTVFGNKRLTAKATIAGVPTVLEIDTGAIGNPYFVLADTPVGREVLSRPGLVRETGFSAAGKQDVVSASNVPVRLGARERPSNVTVMPGGRDAGCGVEGRVGLDVLRACVLTIGERSYRLRCPD